MNFSLMVLIPLLLASHLPAASNPELGAILNSCAEYCERLQNSTLDFVCIETIHEDLYKNQILPQLYQPNSRIPRVDPYKIVRSVSSSRKWVYDYQMIYVFREITEKRILLKENGKKRHVENAKIQTDNFVHACIFRGAIGILSRANQAWFDYSVSGKKRLWKRDVVLLDVRPKPGVKTDRLYGTAWVDARDHTILRIVWNPVSIRNYPVLEKKAAALRAKPEIKIVSEYRFHEKGLRFPSRYHVREEYVTSRNKRFLNSITDVQYEKYKFFTVETDIKIKEPV